MYITGAHGHELNERVRADVYNYCMHIITLPDPGPGPVLCMIHERHVILKATLHTVVTV